MNVLIVRLSSMGDVLHTLPAMRALRRSLPDAQLGWVVEDSHARLLMGLKEIDHLYVVSRQSLKKGWKARIVMAREMKHLMREVHWDLAIDFQGLIKSYWIARWAGARCIAGYAPSPEKTHWFYNKTIRLPSMDRHAVDRNLDLVAALGFSIHREGNLFVPGSPMQGPTSQTPVQSERDFSLLVQPGDRNRAIALLTAINIPENGRRILINFSARKEANRWGTEAFAELIELLQERGYSPVLTGGPSDAREAELIQSKLTHPIPSLVGQCNLLELAAIMENFDLLVTGDTGPMHLAVAAGLPVLAIFGPANPIRTGPYTHKAVVIQKPRDCQPCYARHCRFKQEPPPCLQEISALEILAEVEKICDGKTLRV